MDQPPAAPHPPAPASGLPGPARLFDAAAVVVPPLEGEPPRTARVAFWHSGSDPVGPGAAPLTVALPDGRGTVRTTAVPALLLPVDRALPLLTRARAAGGTAGAGFWGAAALVALELAAQGRLVPHVDAAGRDVWRFAPLPAARLDELAALMPPTAHALPLPGSDPLRVTSPEEALRTFLDAVADTLPRTPAARLAAGDPAFTASEPQHVPHLRDWAESVAAGREGGVDVVLRLEAEGLDDAAAAPRLRCTVRLRSRTEPGVEADAPSVWKGDAPPGAFGPGTRETVLLTLRRAARAWDALGPLLREAVPDSVELAEEELVQLLDPATARGLAAAGVHVEWPRELPHSLEVSAVVGSADAEGAGGGPGCGLLSAEALLSFGWRFAVGGRELSRSELDRLAEADRPLVRLRDTWVLVDPRRTEEARRRTERASRSVTPPQALGALLSGTAEAGGEEYAVEAAGPLERLRRLLADPEHGDGEGPPPPPPELAATLRDYQLRGYGWLSRMTGLGLGCCLADDMGLGKTVQLVALHLYRQRDPATSGPTLVVCPASLLANWQREIARFAPDAPVRRHHGASRALAGAAGFVLTTYGTLLRDAEQLAGVDWGLVVADEAQHIKNPSSATAQAIRTLPAQARVALTGTPVENNLTELWAILDWACPSVLGRLGTFRRRFADAVEAGGDPAAAERLGRLVGPFLLRRRKTDPGIAPELPPKTETDRTVALTDEQAGLYEAVVREGLAQVAGSDGLARRGRVVGLLTSLKQVCNHPAQYLKQDDAGLAGRSGKLELLDELLDTLLTEGAGILVFTQYVQMARLLERHLHRRGVPNRLLHGGTSVQHREEMVRSFQDGAFPVFLLSLKAAGTGLNLTRAGHVVHYDRWWNPAVEEQATDRAHRIGQHRTVQVHRLIAEGTVEDRIDRLLRRKRALAEAVLGGGASALTELTDAELAELVALRQEER